MQAIKCACRIASVPALTALLTGSYRRRRRRWCRRKGKQKVERLAISG